MTVDQIWNTYVDAMLAADCDAVRDMRNRMAHLSKVDRDWVVDMIDDAEDGLNKSIDNKRIYCDVVGIETTYLTEDDCSQVLRDIIQYAKESIDYTKDLS